MAAALVGLVYGICAGVIWAAYHEFSGSQSLLDYTPLVAADPTPLKLLPKDRTQDEAAASRGPAGQGAGAPALADAARPASPTNEIRRATARGPGAERASGSDPSAVAEAADSAQSGADPGLAADDLMPEEWSVAAAPKTRFEVHAAASREAAPAVSDEPQSAPAAALPSTPALKPLDVIPTEVAAVAPAATAAPETARRRAGSGTPPRPSLKPIVMPSKTRPDPTREHDTRAVASTGQTLPKALRAFWTNLKILLASAPASSDRRVGGDGSDRWGAPGNRGDSSGDNDGRTHHAGSGSTGGNGGGGTSASGSGGGTSSGGSGSGGSSASSGGGSSASSGGGGSTSSGASGGGGGNGGKGGNDKGGGGNANGGGKGGKGGNGGGRGGGRGGDDDDDD